MKEILYSTKYLDLIAAKRKNQPDWVYAKRPNVFDVAVIVPVLYRLCNGIMEKSTIFLLTKRPPLIEEYGDKFCVEFPAGLAGDENKNETILQAIEKELLEETGYKADNIEIQTAGLISSGGLTNEKSTLAIAHIHNPFLYQKPVDDGGVIAERVEVLIKNVPEFLDKMEKEGNFLSAQMLSGLYFLNKL